ncbi:outer membrane-specific lipoprotein transporter subunit LolE [Vibrio sp. qd031]|nr:outer membrane-specific lipoprotein transporter subunit LolE [Vibrio sp. qd031]
MGSLSLFIGQRFSRAKQRNNMVSFISVSSILGIAVGVAVIIVGLSAMNGFERELELRLLSVIPHGDFQAVEGGISDWQTVVDIAQSDPQVVAAAPFIKWTALAEKGNQLKALELNGVLPDQHKKVSSLQEFTTPDDAMDLQPNSMGVVLGKRIAEQLNVSVGDSFTLLIPTTQDGAGKVAMPKRARVTLAGVLSIGGQLDGSVGYMHLQDAQKLMGMSDSVTGVALKTNDVLDAQSIMKRVGNQLPVFVYINSWKRDFGFIYRDIQLVRTIMYFVMVLVIGVACFNIISTLMMSVKDRASDIAILRTMGAGDSLIKRVFMWHGVFTGVLGALVGTVFGVLLSLYLTQVITALETLIGHQFLSGDIYFIDFLPSQLMWGDVASVSLTAIGLSLLATWFPAKKAAQLNPARVLSSK